MLKAGKFVPLAAAAIGDLAPVSPNIAIADIDSADSVVEGDEELVQVAPPTPIAGAGLASASEGDADADDVVESAENCSDI
jgi:hypothetical protein